METILTISKVTERQLYKLKTKDETFRMKHLSKPISFYEKIPFYHLVFCDYDEKYYEVLKWLDIDGKTIMQYGQVVSRETDLNDNTGVVKIGLDFLKQNPIAKNVLVKKIYLIKKEVVDLLTLLNC